MYNPVKVANESILRALASDSFDLLRALLWRMAGDIIIERPRRVGKSSCDLPLGLVLNHDDPASGCALMLQNVVYRPWRDDA